MDDTTEIGSITACIAGDHRYTSTIKVEVTGDKAHVITQENGAAGGMDGPGGSMPFHETGRITVACTAAAIVKAIKQAVNKDRTVKAYGKPTKNFYWTVTRTTGLSTARCQAALDSLKGDEG